MVAVEAQARGLEGVACRSRDFGGGAVDRESWAARVCCFLEGVEWVGGERRSKRPRTMPFFWGVGPTNVRCARGVRVTERGES